MSELTFFRVVNSKNPCSVFRGLVTWFPKRYTVKMVDESAAYEGEVMMDVMSTYCQTFEISMEKYIEECKAAFKTNSEKSLYSFSVEEDRLNVRKLSDGAQSGSNVRVILTSVFLKTIDYSSAVIELLDGALQCNGNFSQKIDTLSNETASLRTDNKKMVILLEEMEKEKLQFESIIYHKLVNLLNSKKEFYIKEGTSASKKEPKDHPMPLAENLIPEEIFDADTDSDEIDDTLSPRQDQPGPSNVAVPSKESPKRPITSYSSPPKRATVESVLSSFSFLDPSISFSNK